jgi:hypothetical protein
MFKPSPRNTQRLVEEQVRKWQLDSEASDSRSAAKPSAPRPVIAVSREFGALGAATGRIVAEKLDFSFWDQEIVHAIVEHTGAQKSLLASLDERTRSQIEDVINENLVGAEGTAGEYVRQVAWVVRTIERHGGAVIMGRGAYFILAPETSLRVRVVCPEAMRIERFAQREGLDKRDAEKQVRRVDRERQVFNKRHYGKEVSDPLHYDLVVNTGWSTHEAAAGVVVAAYHAKFGRCRGSDPSGPPEAVR